jgi:hypothetical protein
VAVFLRIVVALLVVFAVSGGDAFAQATSTPAPTSSAAAPTPVPCATPPIGVQIVLENPAPGDTLISGTQVVMNGIAYDTGATSGSGIASVTIYLGARDAGGLSLGTAILGQPNPSVPAGSQFATAGFSLRTPPLPSGNGARSIFVYARSTVGNAEGVLEVPIFLNTQPTPVRGQVPTAVVPTPPPCTPTPVPTATTPPTNTPAPALISESTPTPRATPTPLSVAAPPPPAPAAAAAPPPAAAPAPAAPAAAPAPVAVAPATAQTTAPRGGGIPTSVGLLLLVLGGGIVAAGMSLRRRR